VAQAESAAVLLTGESGTGKELVARAIHAQSTRSDQPFVEVNCSALPENLVESELFGHERGAFTDARSRKQGLAELADGGTLFLDEIGDMPAAAQAKVLRFLEDSRFKRVGGTSDIKVDARVIAATNHDLDRMVESGAFRSDLFFRLKVVPIHIPPLRERREDIVPLALFFVEQLSRDLKRDSATLTESALRVLEGYSWPGNARSRATPGLATRGNCGTCSSVYSFSGGRAISERRTSPSKCARLYLPQPSVTACASSPRRDFAWRMSRET